MKYYHLVVFSILLSISQWVLQSFFNLELAMIIKKIFFGLQATLLISYSLFFLIYLANRKKKGHEKERPTVVSIESRKHHKEASSYSKAS